MKLISLIKAVLSEDMNLFKYVTKKNSSKTKKLLLPIALFIIVVMSVGVYAFMLAEELHKYNITYIMLSIVLAIVTILAFIEGIYKSQGILFDSKDNDLLFSLPIKKSYILFIKILKLLLFQYIYNLMFLLPAFIVYIIFEKPNLNFYLLSFLMTFLVPLVPTIVASFLGYIIKLISSKSKSKKIVQTILSTILLLGIYFVSMNTETFFQDIASKATNINDFLCKIYYPIGAYIQLINKFEIIMFAKLLLIHILPFALFIMIGSKYYFNIISNLKNVDITLKNSNKQYTIKSNKQIISLAKKEMKRFFSSSVYMFNTTFGLVLLVVFTILLCFKDKQMIINILSQYGVSKDISTSLLYYGLILFSGMSTSITSSSISLEGKTINITKSLPVSVKTILQSKILYCYFIEMPFMILSEILFFIKFRPSMLYFLIIVILSITVVLLSAVIGLIINLKYPKLDFKNDTEVVKQSMSSFLSVGLGMGILLSSFLIIGLLNKYLSLTVILVSHMILLSIVTVALYLFLMKIGPNEYKKLNV